jgi:DNA invertase Pin-like site-specific DNA recombinase
MDVIAYVRVSTSEQSLAGYGLPVQERAIRQWAKAHKHRVVQVFTDVASGATSPTDRPGLSAALDALLPPPKATGFVVLRLDRLARDLLQQEAALQVAWRAGAEVFAVDGGQEGSGLVAADDPNEPTRKLVRRILGLVSEYERDLIRKRLQDGRRHKAEQGGHAGGTYPFGYEGGTNGRHRDAVLQPDEQATVGRIAELRRQGESYRSIAATLDDEGRKPRRAASWSAMSVRNVAERASA